MYATLQQENETLRHRVRELEEALRLLTGDEELPLNWGLSPDQQVLFRLLLRRVYVTREAADAVLHRPWREYGGSNTVAVHIHYMRRKLHSLGIEIKSCWRSGLGTSGYYLLPETKILVKKMLARDIEARLV